MEKDLKKKVALITCYFQRNYGSQLQAYATQMVVDDMQLDYVTIAIEGLSPEIKRAKYKYFLSRIFDVSTVKEKLGTVRRQVALKTNRAYAHNVSIRNQFFDDFSGRNFKLSPKINGFQELGSYAKKFDAFIVGSDQLWLPSNITADYYTLNFVPREVCKISFSTSFGVSKLPYSHIEKAKRFLSRFDHISVREESGKNLIKSLINREVPIVCDPTIMFSSSRWNELIPNSRFYNFKYIFCYFLGNNPWQRKWVKSIQEKTNLKIVQLQHCDEYIRYDESFADYAPYNVGPFEFVQLIRDAEYVCTDSFHCTVFSLLFKKEFYTFKRFCSDTHVSTNGRLYSLLNNLSLSSRLVIDPNTDFECVDPIDWNLTDSKISGLRDFSWNWLKNSLL